MTDRSPARPSVVVLGGGYGGINAAKALDDVADVTLVDPTEAFVHNVAAWRSLVEPEWLDRIFLPYEHLLAHGRFLYAATLWTKASVGSTSVTSATSSSAVAALMPP